MDETWDFFLGMNFMPHGHCYFWYPGMVWLQVLSNAIIAIAYFWISSMLILLIRRIKGIPFKPMFIAFGAFIVACGFTHVMDIVVIWNPTYWVDGIIRALTALISIGTAVCLPPLIPKVIDLVEAFKTANERGVKLETMLKDLGSMYEKTKELEQLKTQFFANVSHELRTPLALIMAPAEKLTILPDSGPEQKKAAELILKNSKILLKHVNDLLDLSKLEAGKAAVEYSVSDVASLVRTSAQAFEGHAQDRKISFTIHAPETLSAEIDPHKFARIVMNLLSNAFKFTPLGGSVKCALEAPQNDVAFVLRVSDSGPGIPEKDRATIFERFRQLEGGSTRKFGGTGLGLSIVKNFAELHGGSVSVGSSSEGGALFTVKIPLKAPTGAVFSQSTDTAYPLADTIVLEKELEAFESSPSADKPKVLVVEDNLDLNRMICEELAVDYEIENAFDGAEGYQKSVEIKPDVVVTDIMMPGTSGDQFIRMLRSNPDFDNVPVLILTAKADDEMKVNLLADGAQDYVIKPFSVVELKARVKNLATMKRATDILQRELDSQMKNLEGLAKEVTHRNKELQDAVESMRAAREHAEKASKLKNNFLGMVSHELRSPMTSMELQIEVLRRDPQLQSPKQQEILAKVLNSSSRLKDLIESLLQYARIDSGKLSTEVVEFDPVVLCLEATEEHRPYAEQKSLKLEMHAEKNIPLMKSDPKLLRLVLVNLIANAIKYTTEGHVTVSLSFSRATYRFSVEDSGVGIPKSHHYRVFEPFERLEAIKDQYLPGVGLGLALVKEIVTSLGGDISLESDAGQGSTFTVRLPQVFGEKVHGVSA